MQLALGLLSSTWAEHGFKLGTVGRTALGYFAAPVHSSFCRLAWQVPYLSDWHMAGVKGSNATFLYVSLEAADNYKLHPNPLPTKHQGDLRRRGWASTWLQADKWAQDVHVKPEQVNRSFQKSLTLLDS